jgi:hypothetical protein
MNQQGEIAKPKTDAEVCSMADARIRELLKTHGPNLSEEDVMAGFSHWVLPDRHLTMIRERLERWKGVAARRAARKRG